MSVGKGDDLLDVRAGFDYRVQDDLHFLVAAATGLSEPDEGDELDYDLYFGVLFLLERDA
jgi:hypothetical protein